MIILLNLLQALLHELLASVNGIIHIIKVRFVSLPLLVVHAEEHSLHGLLNVEAILHLHVLLELIVEI